jgi:hypothetical protein
MRILLGAGAEREVVARVGEELPTIDDDGTVWEWPSFRWIAAADPPWWYMVPMIAELLPPKKDAFVVFLDDQLHEEVEENADHVERDGLVFLEINDTLWAVWLPISAIAGELVLKADHWRRQRRVPLDEWPEWM